ncbi:MAG: hypothetical protein OEV44_10770, partial [Spirochaetota bacterium]|nr:hypothetical protein [Spirochaetota bacterium]
TISDFSEINKFTQLKSFIANSNEIKKLSSLPYNNTIKYCNLDNNTQLNDLSDLLKLKKLQNLSISFSRRVDKFPILPILENLSLTNVEEINRTLQHIPVLQTLQSIDVSSTQNLYLSNFILYNKETKSTSIRFPNLKTINLFNNQLNEIIALQYYPDLENIYLSNNKLTNIDALSLHKKINELNAANNQLETLNFTENHQSIKKLNMSNNSKLDNFDNLKYLKSIEILDVSNTRFEDLKNLSCNKVLKNLNIIDCKIKNIPELINFKNLETLYVNDYLSMTDAVIISKLTSLHHLYIKTDYRNEKQRLELKKLFKNKNINFI